MAPLPAIRQREQLATTGPWQVFRAEDILIENEAGDVIVDLCYPEADEDAHQRSNDAEFIAHARSDIPWLLTERDRLVEEVARLQAELDSMRGALNPDDPIKVGQVWHESDKRFQRDVRVVGVQGNKIGIRNVATNRLSYAKRERFGRSGGYRLKVAAPLHEAPHPDTDQLMQCLQRQLDAVDRAVGFPHEDGKGRIQLIDELKAPAACVCSVPDFIGYVGEPEHWRCLLCGRQPSTTETIHVRLFKRPGLHEAPHPPQTQQWQPIDTAPKDGTEILLLEDRRIVNGSWNRGGAMHMPHWMGGLFHPTHWQPTIALPLSPPTHQETP